MIAAYANTTLLGTFPPNATYVNGHTVTNFPADLISQAKNVAAGFDTTAIRSMTAFLKKFNTSGLTNNLPNGLNECSAQSSKILKPISRDPTTQDSCPGVNDTCLAAKTIFFSGVNPVFKDSVSIANLQDNMPIPTCGAGGRNAVWQVVPPVAAAGRQFVVSTSGSNFDTLMSVWSGTCSNLTQVGCADNVRVLAGRRSRLPRTESTHSISPLKARMARYGKVKMSVQSF